MCQETPGGSPIEPTRQEPPLRHPTLSRPSTAFHPASNSRAIAASSRKPCQHNVHDILLPNVDPRNSSTRSAGRQAKSLNQAPATESSTSDLCPRRSPSRFRIPSPILASNFNEPLFSLFSAGSPRPPLSPPNPSHSSILDIGTGYAESQTHFTPDAACRHETGKPPLTSLPDPFTPILYKYPIRPPSARRTDRMTASLDSSRPIMSPSVRPYPPRRTTLVIHSPSMPPTRQHPLTGKHSLAHRCATAPTA